MHACFLDRCHHRRNNYQALTDQTSLVIVRYLFQKQECWNNRVYSCAVSEIWHKSISSVTHMESPLKTRIDINVLFVIVLRKCTVSGNLTVMKAMTKERIVHHSPESCRPLSLSKHKVNGSTETEKKFHRNRAKHDIIYYILLALKRTRIALISCILSLR